MGCSNCKSKKDLKLQQTLTSLGKSLTIDHTLPKEAYFQGFFGRLFYFLILMVIALTPIINLAAVYVFYKAVFSKNLNKKVKNVEKHKNFNESE
jgi:hypothetical protein